MTKPSDKSVLIVHPLGDCTLAELLGTQFSVRVVSDVMQIEMESVQELAVVLVDALRGHSIPLVLCRQIKALTGFDDMPVMLAVSETEPLDMMQVYDAGVDDVLTSSMSSAELLARVQKATFHSIANRQLKGRLMQANQMAMSAMSDTSDLGTNIQFLVHCHECSNLDELGMLLFRTLAHYGIHCSLQLRSEFEIKNLEENGLAKDLEARLLTELKNSGRYVDFGRRCVMNYGQVSLLVKNMPEDPRRFGTIKDNVFSLLQGADARVKSIDNGRMLELERDILRGMSHKMQGVMQQVESRYQTVMKECATAVEDMAMRVDEAILFLDLTEAQENTFSQIMSVGVTTINRLFNEGIRIDTSFRKLVDYLNTSLSVDERRTVEEMKRILDRL